MPIYEFECSTCGTRFDRLQKLSDPDPDVCQECGKASVKRRLTAPSFRLAGKGWYETDFKKDGDKQRNLAEKAEPAKTESKPAESAPEKPKAAEKKETPKAADKKPSTEKPKKSAD